LDDLGALIAGFSLAKSMINEFLKISDNTRKIKAISAICRKPAGLFGNGSGDLRPRKDTVCVTGGKVTAPAAGA
jgi:hypothetical protein